MISATMLLLHDAYDSIWTLFYRIEFSDITRTVRVVMVIDLCATTLPTAW